MRINKITIDNFKSFTINELDLTNFSNNILVIGKNQDQGGMDSNESGKSAFLESILWNIFGTFPGMVSADSVVRRGEDQCKVDIFYDNDFSIGRERGKKNRTELYISGELQKFKTDTLTQEEIFKVFGLNITPKIALNDFYNRAYFSPFVLKSFASPGATSADRINLIMRFLGLDKVEQSIPKFKNKKKELKDQLEHCDIDISKVNSELDYVKLQIESVVDRFNNIGTELEKYKSKESDLEKRNELRHQMDRLDNELMILRRSYKENRDYMRRQYDQLVKEIESYSDLDNKIEVLEEKFNSEEYESLIASNDAYHSEVDSIDSKLNDLESVKLNINSSIVKLKNELSKVQACPNCDTTLMVDKDRKIKKYDAKKLNEDIDEKQLEYNSLVEHIEAINDERNGFVDKLSKVSDKLSEYTDLRAQLEKYKILYDGYSKRIREKEWINKEGKEKKKEFESKEYKLNEKIIELKSRVKLIQIPDGLKGKIDNLNTQIRQSEAELATYKSEKKHNEELVEKYNKIEKLNKKVNSQIVFEDQAIDLVNRGIKASINQFLPVFSETVNKYLDIFDSGLQFYPEIDSESIRDSFKLWIDDGNEKYLIDERSRGAQTRVAIAVGFSLIELSGSPIGFLMADEIVDSLDSTGIDLFFEVLNSDGLKDIQKFIISHDSSLKNYFNDVITIVKENGVSNIEV